MAASNEALTGAEKAKVDDIMTALTNFEAKADAGKGGEAANVCKAVAAIVEKGTVSPKMLKALQELDGDKSEMYFINRLNKAMDAVGSTARSGDDFAKASQVLSASRSKHATLGCGPEPDAFMGTRLCGWVC